MSPISQKVRFQWAALIYCFGTLFVMLVVSATLYHSDWFTRFLSQITGEELGSTLRLALALAIGLATQLVLLAFGYLLSPRKKIAHDRVA